MNNPYEVDVALMRGTIRWARGETDRRALRKSMLRAGWSEPNLSAYLGMVQRAMRQVNTSQRSNR